MSSETKAPDKKLPWQGYAPPWHAVFQEYDPDLMAAFRTWQRYAMTPKELAVRTRELMIVAIDCVVEWPSPFIDSHIHAALDHGATTQSMLEAIGIAEHFGGGAGLNHGIFALMQCIRDRRAEGVRTPRRASEKDGDTDPGTEFEGSDPKSRKLFKQWQDAALTREELDEKSRALISIGIDAHIAWPPEYMSLHMHEAFDAGASIQEVLESVATANHFGHAFNHGLTAMGEVIDERKSTGSAPVHRKS